MFQIFDGYNHLIPRTDIFNAHSSDAMSLSVQYECFRHNACSSISRELVSDLTGANSGLVMAVQADVGAITIVVTARVPTTRFRHSDCF